jgi:spore coat polysaccharide biosynthesis protein SpsF (cytidylyltransferase family)
MGSTRLPGKVMMPLGNRPLLGFLIERLRLCRTIDEVVVATSIENENDVIEEFCANEGIACFRGSEEDVLKRTLGALESVSATIGVEVFGDCPLIDPLIVDDIVTKFLDHARYHFIGNDLKTTYPPGMEVEVFSVAALQDSDDRVAASDPIREHGTLFIRQNPQLYKVINLEAEGKRRRPEVELEVDSREDLDVVTAIIQHFDPRIDFSLDEVLRFLDDNPEIVEINRSVHRRWKEFRDD